MIKIETIVLLLLAAFLSWEADMIEPKPYPLGDAGDTLMVRIIGYEFCPHDCDIDHFHTGHKKDYNCETPICDHIIYEKRYR